MKVYIAGKIGTDTERETLEKIESNMHELESALHLALQTDIQARLRNKDIEEFIFLNLNAVIRKRQALERYLIDQNADALLAYAGQEFPE